MKRIIEAMVTAGVLMWMQPASASWTLSQVSSYPYPQRPQIVPGQFVPTNQGQSNNQMANMLSSWGFVPIACQGNVAEIRHGSTGEIACIQPNQEIGVGKFVYDLTSNQIRPDAQFQTNYQIQPNFQSPANYQIQPNFQSPTNYQIQPNVQSTSATNQRDFGYINPVPQTQDPRIGNMVFVFDNAYDYGTCVDAILLAYEGRQAELQGMNKNECANQVINLFGTSLSGDLALQLVDLANYRATKLLPNRLYPSLGLRQRVAMNLGYVYNIDKNNQEILNYAASKKRQSQK